MTRIVVVLERKRWPPWKGRDHFDRIIDQLRTKYRFMPDTDERLSDDFVEIPFAPRSDLREVRREVVEALDSIDRDWRRHVSMIKGPSGLVGATAM